MKKINYLNAIRGIACLIVLFCHCKLAFFNRSVFLQFGAVEFLTNGELAVCVFLSISSYLLYEKLQIRNKLDDIGKMCVKRYFRLAIPVFVSSLFALILQQTVGFHNIAVGQALNNEWFTNYYTVRLDFASLIRSSLYGVLLFGNNTFNGPFWMLKTLFLGGFLVQFFSVISRKMKKSNRYIALSLLLICFFVRRSLFFSVVLGMLWAELSHEKSFIETGRSCNRIKKVSLYVIVLLLCIFSGYQSIINGFLRSLISFDCFIFDRIFWHSVIAFLVLLCCSMIFDSDDLKESNLLVRSGTYSMGIYLFHWPFLCSITSLLYEKLILFRGEGISVYLQSAIFVFSMLSIVLIAWLYTNLIEKKLSSALNRLINR